MSKCTSYNAKGVNNIERPHSAQYSTINSKSRTHPFRSKEISLSKFLNSVPFETRMCVCLCCRMNSALVFGLLHSSIHLLKRFRLYYHTFMACQPASSIQHQKVTVSFNRHRTHTHTLARTRSEQFTNCFCVCSCCTQDAQPLYYYYYRTHSYTIWSSASLSFRWKLNYCVLYMRQSKDSLYVRSTEYILECKVSFLLNLRYATMVNGNVTLAFTNGQILIPHLLL